MALDFKIRSNTRKYKHNEMVKLALRQIEELPHVAPDDMLLTILSIKISRIWP